jgi:hypothetical protein
MSNYRVWRTKVRKSRMVGSTQVPLSEQSTDGHHETKSSESAVLIPNSI